MAVRHQPHKLYIERSERGRRQTLALTGELDMYSVSELEESVSAAVTSGGELVLALDGLTFMDSSGLRAILSCLEFCAESHCAFALTPARPQVQRVFEITRAVDHLPFLTPAGAGGEGPVDSAVSPE